MGLSTNSENFPKENHNQGGEPGCDLREHVIMRQTRGKIREA